MSRQAGEIYSNEHAYPISKAISCDDPASAVYHKSLITLIVYCCLGGPEEQLPQEVVGGLGEGEGDGTPQSAQGQRRRAQADPRVPHRQETHLQQDPRRAGAGQGHGPGVSQKVSKKEGKIQKLFFHKGG